MQLYPGAIQLQVTDLIMTHANVIFTQSALKISVGMDQHVIHSIIATALNVLLYLDALQTTGLIMKLAIANLC